jgi:small subunit ribosomal protein S9
MINIVNGTGRRKCSTARVYLYPQGTGKFTVNNKQLDSFFIRHQDQELAQQPFSICEDITPSTWDVKVRVSGGGTSGQAGAVRLGLARAMVLVHPELKKALRTQGWLTRDARMVERKKPGRVKARKVQQFKKR